MENQRTYSRKLLLVDLLIIICAVLGGLIIYNGKHGDKFEPNPISTKEMVLSIGPDMMRYLRTEEGIIHDIHTLRRMPNGVTIVVADVKVIEGNRTNSRAVLLTESHAFKKGDVVDVHWVYHGTPAGGHHEPYVVAKK